MNRMRGEFKEDGQHTPALPINLVPPIRKPSKEKPACTLCTGGDSGLHLYDCTAAPMPLRVRPHSEARSCANNFHRPPGRHRERTGLEQPRRLAWLALCAQDISHIVALRLR